MTGEGWIGRITGLKYWSETLAMTAREGELRRAGARSRGVRQACLEIARRRL